MTTDLQEQLTKYLSDAHAIEEQALAQLRTAPGIAGDPELADAYRVHLAETEAHEARIRGLLEGRDAKPSWLKDLVMSVGGKGFVLFARVQPDTAGKLHAHALSYEALEYASYDLLARVAERAEETAVAEAARSIRDEERAMMDRLEAGFDRAVEATVRELKPSDLAGQVAKYLADAHALEQQSLELLERAAGETRDTTLAGIYAEHLDETRDQAELVHERLHALGGERSALKDAALRLGAMNWATFFKGHPDTPGKLAAFAYAVEHLEIGGYEQLRRFATVAGDEETARLAGADPSRRSARRRRGSRTRSTGRRRRRWSRWALAGSGELPVGRRRRRDERLGRPAERAEERVDDLGRELGAPAVANLGGGLGDRQRALIRPLGRHRVPGVGEPRDRRLERDAVAGEARGIAGAVPALVVVADDRHGAVQAPELADDPRALVRMALHELVLLVGETAGLAEDGVRDGELADVVEEARVAEHGQPVGRKAELRAERDDDPADALRVTGGVGILRLDRRVQALDRLERAVLEAAIGLEQLPRAIAEGDRLPAHAHGRAAHEQDEREPEGEEDRAGGEPDRAPVRGDRPLERRRVGVDLVGADDLAVHEHGCIDLEDALDPERRLGGVLGVVAELLELALGLARLERLLEVMVDGGSGGRCARERGSSTRACRPCSTPSC